jgi:hypothetical protein
MQPGNGFLGTGLSPKKVGIIAMVVLGLLTVGRWMVSGSADIAHHDHPLTPRDYLNASQSDPAPFDFCPIFGPGDIVAERRGQWGLLKSRLHQGSNARIQRVVQKALSGMPVTISVLGGSVSACHGAGDDPIHPKCYPSKFFAWWNSVFPHPASELTNGATRKSDSAYFAYCSGHHLPDKTDLVILEFDSSDPNDSEWLNHFELLVRSILVRPDMPAIIILGHFSPQIQAQSGFAGPELLHTVVAQFYDVPHISTKGLLYHDYLANPEAARSTFYTDPVLANPTGHDLLADVLISYMMQQVCDGWSATMGHAFDVPYMGSDGTDSTTGGPNLFGGVGQRKGLSPIQKESDGGNVGATDSKYAGLKVPSARLSDRPSDILQFREIEPFCVSANDLINPLPPSLFYGSGWHDHHPTKGDGHDDMHYWYAEQPTSRIRVPIQLGAGDVAIYYLQAPEDQPLGSVSCWVDDNVGGAVELSGVADVPSVMPTLTMIDRHVARGSHFVECALLGVEGQPTPPFKILGIFTT